MGYILELRKQVGHRPLIMTCAGVLLLNEKRELLLQKRADNGLWGYPGGSMELGESFKDCARREVQEETGLICGKLEHFMNVSGEEVHYVYPNGDEIYAAEEIFFMPGIFRADHLPAGGSRKTLFFPYGRTPTERADQSQ